VEIIKQLYDIAFLFDLANEFDMVKASYIRNAEHEMKYRGLNLHWKDTLQDTVRACLTITTGYNCACIFCVKLQTAISYPKCQLKPDNSDTKHQ
jgi:hypothetical protein